MSAGLKPSKAPRDRRRDLAKGHRGETLAALSLILKGYRILERRYRTPVGEIDIIAKRGDLIAIVEVKARRTLAEAMDAVGPASQRRIEAAADRWLRRRRDHARLSVRFDIVAVLPRSWPVHIPHAWQARS